MPFVPPPFSPFVWQDLPSTATPVDAADLNNLETIITAYTQTVIQAYDAYIQAIISPGSSGTPANTVLPAISGTVQQGDQLTTTSGTWTSSPTGYVYQWQSGTTVVRTSPSTTATTDTYTLQSSDVGNLITVTVTASNAAGSRSAISASVGPVAGLGVPVLLTSPVIVVNG